MNTHVNDDIHSSNASRDIGTASTMSGTSLGATHSPASDDASLHGANVRDLDNVSGFSDEDDEDATVINENAEELRDLVSTASRTSPRNGAQPAMTEVLPDAISADGVQETRKGVAIRSDKSLKRDRLPLGFLLHERYRIDGILGSGGFGVVYSAVDTRDNRPVAVKTLRNTLDNHDIAAKRFQREIDLCASIQSEHVVKIFDHGSTIDADGGETLFYTMELLDGKTLDEYIAGREKFTFYEVKTIMLQVLDGLAEAHRKHIVHRDLKPANICLREDPPDSHQFDVKVLDFGIAKVIDGDQNTEKLTQSGNWMGSPAYMSPEHLKGCDVTPASDIFSLGLIMLEMILGYPAIDGDSPMDSAMLIVSQDPVPIADWILESSLGPIIEQCVRKSPVDRIQNGDILAQAFRALDDDVLKNEFAASKLRKRNNRDVSSLQPTPVAEPTITSEAIERERRRLGINLFLFIGIALCVFTILIIVFVKIYVDKSTNDPEPLPTVELTPTEKALSTGLVRGACLGALSPLRLTVTISSMPVGASIYRASDNQFVGKTPVELSILPARGDTWSLVARADGYADYPLFVNLWSSSTVALTMERLPPSFDDKTPPPPPAANPSDMAKPAEVDKPTPAPAASSKKSESEVKKASKTSAKSTKSTSNSSKSSNSAKTTKGWSVDDVVNQPSSGTSSSKTGIKSPTSWKVDN